MDYDPLRPYLHSRALRWSYPTMFGRPGDAWTNAVAELPVPELVRTLSEVGFEGILVDRDGYADDGAAIVAALTAELGADSGARATNRQVFFDLRAANEKAFARAAPGERERRRQEALNRPLLRWPDGFFPPEHDPGTTFRWCAGDCAIEIDNPAEHDARVIVSMRVSAGQAPASLRVTGDLWDEDIALVPGGTPISRALRVPAGRHWIRLRSEARRRSRRKIPGGSCFASTTRACARPTTRRERLAGAREGRQLGERVAIAGAVRDVAAVTRDEGSERLQIEPPQVAGTVANAGMGQRRGQPPDGGQLRQVAHRLRDDHRAARGAAQPGDDLVGAVGEMVEARADHDVVGVGIGSDSRLNQRTSAPRRRACITKSPLKSSPR